MMKFSTEMTVERTSDYNQIKDAVHSKLRY